MYSLPISDTHLYSLYKYKVLDNQFISEYDFFLMVNKSIYINIMAHFYQEFAQSYLTIQTDQIHKNNLSIQVGFEEYFDRS